MICSMVSEAGSSAAAIRAVRLRPSSVQKSHTRSGSSNTTPSPNGDQRWKLRLRFSCQPGCRDAAHCGSVGSFARRSTDEGVR